MKTKISYSLLAAAMACGIAQGAETAYTTPVGYVTLDIPAGSDSNVGQPLQRTLAMQALATSVAGSVVTVSGAALAVNQFVFAPPGQPNNFYLQAIGGPLNGLYFDVVSNTATTITVDNGTTDISSITNFKVIPFWTLQTLFPSGAGVGTSTDSEESNGVVSFQNPAATGVNRPPAKFFFHYTGADLQGTGWYDFTNTSLGLQDNMTIDPFLTARVRNIGGAKTVVISGTVPTSDVATPIVRASTTNDSYVAVQFPLDLTLAQSGLSAVVTPSTDIEEAIDILQTFDETATGQNKPPTSFYFYYEGPAEQGTGWYNFANVSLGKQDNVAGILKAGRAYTIRKAAGTPSLSQAISSPPFTLPN